MIERIQRIARVKRIDNDVGRSYDEQKKGGGRSFLDELNAAMGKKNTPKPVKISDPYKLELTSVGTQSLFYYGSMDLEALLPTR